MMASSGRGAKRCLAETHSSVGLPKQGGGGVNRYHLMVRYSTAIAVVARNRAALRQHCFRRDRALRGSGFSPRQCGDRSAFVFGKLLVDPSSAVMAPPDPAGQKPSGDRSPRQQHVPQMPDLGPGGLWAQAQDSKSAFSEHRASSSAGPFAEQDRSTAGRGRIPDACTIAQMDHAAIEVTG